MSGWEIVLLQKHQLHGILLFMFKYALQIFISHFAELLLNAQSWNDIFLKFSLVLIHNVP